MNIIPGVLAKTLSELKEQLTSISWAKKIHLDIMDGEFVENKTVQIRELAKLFPKKEVQVHIMAYKPEKYVAPFAKLGAEELIFHAETTEKRAETLEKIRLKGMKAGIAFNPETKITECRDSLVHADTALMMTVHPGKSGQKFLDAPLRKIAQSRKVNPFIQIGVDGGCNLCTCKMISHAGADFAVATSAVTLQENSKKAYQKFRDC